MYFADVGEGAVAIGWGVPENIGDVVSGESPRLPWFAGQCQKAQEGRGGAVLPQSVVVQRDRRQGKGHLWLL